MGQIGIMQRARLNEMRRKQDAWRRNYIADRADQLLAEFHGEIPMTSTPDPMADVQILLSPNWGK
jgi:hypothetical protein